MEWIFNPFSLEQGAVQGILKHADLAQVTILRKIRGNSQESFLRLRVKFWRNSQEFLEILLFNSP